MIKALYRLRIKWNLLTSYGPSMKYLQLKSHFLVKYRMLTPEVWEQARLSALTMLFNIVLEITANAIREAEKSEAHN